MPHQQLAWKWHIREHPSEWRCPKLKIVSEAKSLHFAQAPSDKAISPKRVLIVDDEETFRGILKTFVESLGYVCTEVASARDALGVLKRGDFSIVISDIVMPEMNGLELLRAIKRRHTDVDVLIVSGYGDDYSPMKIVESGASDFLAKPFSLEQLGARLYKIETERTLRNKLYLKGITDDLTGLYNRGYFYHTLRHETERAKRQGHPLSILILDVDRFKTFNDRYGHLKGDALLRLAARVIVSSVREHVDCVFRYGGDEFVVILPEADEAAAEFIGNRIKSNFRDTAPADLTFSMGAAQFHESFGREVFVNLADRRMYEAKAKSKGLDRPSLEISVEKDNHRIRCLNCGGLVHWTSSVCEHCFVDPLKRTDLEKSQEIARTFLREVGGSVEDRRRAPRIRVRKILTDDSLIEAIHNISQGGAQIRTKVPQSVGETIEIGLPLDDATLSTSGVVVYAQPVPGGGSLAGVKFSEMTDENSRLLKRFIEEAGVRL